jgi:signal peptidase I
MEPDPGEKISFWRVVLIGRSPRRTLMRIFTVAGAVVLMWKFVLLPIRVEGISMLPTYRNNQVNLVNRLAYVAAKPQRGDVVAIRMAGENVMLLKRVVGLPGETVAFRQGRLLINGTPMEEPYLKLPSYWNMPPKEVPPDHYYVVGDNRSMNIVDHEHGRTDRKRIVGRALL